MSLPGSLLTGKRARGLVAAVVLGALVPLATTLGSGTAGAQSCPDTGGTVVLNGGICTATFSSTDVNFNPITKTQIFEVPAGVTSLSIVVDGASGGASGDDNFGTGFSSGGQESGTVAVAANSPITPGSTLTLAVGTEGETAGLSASDPNGAGWPDGGSAPSGGGGGGGGSFVYNNSGTLIMAAGGGGGNGGGGGDGSNNCYNIPTPPCGGVGGNGGGTSGGSIGQAGNPQQGGAPAAGSGGGGGGTNSGGNGGADGGTCPAGDGIGVVAASGTPAGNGIGPAPSPFAATPDGGTGETPGPNLLGLPSCYQSGGGGGGGGYYGGGGGGSGYEADGGGGGGSGYASTAVKSPQSGVDTIDVSQITISFSLTNGPTVSSLSATQGPVVGGEPVTILGSGFTGATAVNFVGAGGTTTVTLPTPATSDTSITVNAPDLSGQMNSAGLNTNYTVDVEVVTPGGTSSATPPDDSYTAMVPIVTAVNTTVNGNQNGPAAGPVVGGETVTLTGQWLNGAESVSFQPTTNTDFVTATPVNVGGTGTVAQFTAPNARSEYTAAGATGDLLTDLIVDIPVQNSNTASVTSSPTATGANDKFYLVPVAVTDLADHQAAVVGGTVVEITGTDLSNGTVVLAPASGTQPGKGCGAGSPVNVAPNPGGTDTTLAFTAPDQSDTMATTGGDITCDVEVQVPVPELGSGNTVTSQPNPGNPGDTLTYPYPVVNSISPSAGPVGGGTPFTITGSGLIGVNQVRFSLTGGFIAVPVSATVSPASTLSNTVSATTPLLTPEELEVSGDPTLTTDAEVGIPTLNGGVIYSAANTPADNFTFTTGSGCTSLSSCNTGTSTGSAPAVASSSGPNGSITVTGTGGAGSVTVGRYGANPVGTPAFTTGGSYFDASVGSGSAFTSATLQDCDLGGGTSLQWWNPAANSGAGAWQAVTPLTGPTTTTPPCVTATFGATSSPTLAQLTGTVFVAQIPAAVGVAPTFTVDTPSLTATIGTKYSAMFTATGAPTPTYALAGGAPAFLGINSTTGTVSGTPPTGTTSFTYSVVASNGTLPNATAGPFTVIVKSAAGTAPTFTVDTPPLTATAGTPYSYTFTATGTPAPTYALNVGAPSFLGINATTGVVSGTPPTGTTSFSYSVVASNGTLPNVTAGPFTVVVTGATRAAPKFTVDAPPSTVPLGAPYTYRFTATGNPAPTYSLRSAPRFLTIDPATGAVSGTPPPGATTFSYAVTASNRVGPPAVAGPFRVSVSGNDSITVALAGRRIGYSLSGLSSTGLITIDPKTWGTVDSISGTITLPGEKGGVATVTIWAKAHHHHYDGTIAISDPSAGVHTLTAITGITRVAPGTVRSTGYGYGPHGSYAVTWTLTQRG